MPSVTLIPSNYSNMTNLTADGTNTVDRGYTNAESTTYARFTIPQSQTGYIYYLFNTSTIPAGATITNVTARGKARVSNTSRVTNTVMQLCSGTTTKGSNRTFASTTASTQSITAGSWTRNELNDLRIKIGGTASSASQSRRIDFYGADVTIEYTEQNVPVTGVTLDQSTASVEESGTITLTATVAPSNATDQTVSWSTSDSSIATVSNGVVTGVSTGTATITVTTTDGGFTDTCTVTVTTPTYTEWVQTNTLVSGQDYLIANANTGSLYLVSKDAGNSGELVGVAASVVGGKISIPTSVAAKVTFTCTLEDNNNPDSTLLTTGSDYLYTDSSNRLRIASWTSSMAGKHWHYKADGKDLLWFFKDSNGDTGYTDTSSTYKYYLSCSGAGIYTDLYVSTTSLENTNTPPIYLFTPAPASQDKMYAKINGTWVEAVKYYKKVSG